MGFHTRPHIIASNISKHLNKYNALYELKHGFHEKHSCKTQLIQLVEDLGRQLTGKANKFGTAGL